MALEAAAQILQTALVLLQLVVAHPELPPSVREVAVQVASNAVVEATSAIAASKAQSVALPTPPPPPPPSPIIPADLAGPNATTTFAFCIGEGYEIIETFPRRCKAPGDRYYLEGMPAVAFNQEGESLAGCFVTGCGASLCVSMLNPPPIPASCDSKPEYKCYLQGICARQANGECGWTPSASLSQCLANPPTP